MGMEQQQFRFGLVGFGEIGSTVAAGLRQAGLASVAAYDLHAFDGPFAGLIQSRAAAAGVTLLRSPRELAAAAEVIFGATPGVASVDSAAGFAPHLTAAHVFVDFASATPRIKQAVAAHLAASGALVGDGSIEGTPLQGHAMPMLSSGPAGERIRDLLNPWGMRVEFVGEALGTASGIKILRSVLLKGIEALHDEMLLAARHYGIADRVLASAAKTLARPWNDTVQSLLPSGAIHAKRRAEELEMSAEAVRDAGIAPTMAQAIAQRLRWKESLGLKAHFDGIVPATLDEVLQAIEQRMARDA